MNSCHSIVILALLLSACGGMRMAPDATLGRLQAELVQPAPKPVPKAVAEAPAAALPEPAPAEPRFDLAVNNAPASQVFTALVSGTAYSMLVPPDLAGNITVNLKKVSLREALDTLRDSYGYEYRVQGKRIMIQPNTLQARVFKINYLAGRRQGQTDMRVSSGSITTSSGNSSGASVASTGQAGSSGSAGGRGPDSSRVYTTQDADFWGETSATLKLIVGSEGGRSVVLNPLSGVIVVKAMPAELRQVEAFLKASQIMVERQVMLEAKILQVNLSEGFQTGINWSNFGRIGGDSRFAIGVTQPGAKLQGQQLNDAAGNSQAGTALQNAAGVAVTAGREGIVNAVGAVAGFTGFAFQSANFAALLNFLETQGNVQVLSSPRIATLNNQKAVLKVGTDDFFVTNVTTTTTVSGTTPVTSPSITVQPFFSGIALDVTPQIDDNGTITLHVHPSISDVTQKDLVVSLGGSAGTYTLPLASSNINETDSLVRVKDGQIVAIGGLMKQSQSESRSQLPGLGELPGVGVLFGQRNKIFAKSEVVILIKPTVIRDEADWQQGLDELQERMPGYKPPAPLSIKAH